MKRNSLYIAILLIVSSACVANTSHADRCNLNKELDSAQITENVQEISGERESNNIPRKRKLLLLGGIVSSILQVPGDVVGCISDIPYGDIASTTIEVSAEVVGDIPWYILFASFCCCRCN